MTTEPSDSGSNPPMSSESADLPQSSTQIPVEMAEMPFETRIMQQVFFGPAGLRSGWRLLLFVAGLLLFAALAEIVLTLFFGRIPLVPSHALSPAMLLRNEAGTLIGMSGGYLAVLLFCHQSLREYFWIDTRWLRRVLVGIVAGFCALTILLLSMEALHLARIGRVPDATPRQSMALWLLLQGLFWAAGYVCVALFEEGVFRCFLLRTLLQTFGNKRGETRSWWLAALLSSMIFGGVHWSNHGESLIGISSAAAIGFIFCCTIRWTGSVWWAVGFHACWDWAQSFVYGTPDSGMPPSSHWLTTSIFGPARWTGGATGPEGSLLILPLLVLVLFGTYAAYARRGKSQPA